MHHSQSRVIPRGLIEEQHLLDPVTKKYAEDGFFQHGYTGSLLEYYIKYRFDIDRLHARFKEAVEVYNKFTKDLKEYEKQTKTLAN